MKPIFNSIVLFVLILARAMCAEPSGQATVSVGEARIDGRGDSNRFSDWRQLDGLWYAAKCAGFKPGGREWYHTGLVELERLAEVPVELKPKP